MHKLRIFIADDHGVLREGLTMLVDAQPDMEVVGYATDGRSLARMLRDCQAEIVLMDISMPGGGARATAQILQECPDIQVIALTRHSEPGYVRQLLRAGARGYVLKGAGGSELIDAIRAVAAGSFYLDTTLTDRAVHMYVRAQTESSAQPLPDLSEREAEAALLTARGYTNKEIAAQMGISAKTVDTYKMRAMEKLGLHSRAALVRYALQRGWLDPYE